MKPRIMENPTSNPGISTCSFSSCFSSSFFGESGLLSVGAGFAGSSSRLSLDVDGLRGTMMGSDSEYDEAVSSPLLTSRTVMAAVICWTISLSSSPNVHGLLLARLRTLCACDVIGDEAAASIPSGIITISDVPTSIPTPILDINRNCDCDSDMDSGRAPARNDLQCLLARMEAKVTLGARSIVRNRHYDLFPKLPLAELPVDSIQLSRIEEACLRIGREVERCPPWCWSGTGAVAVAKVANDVTDEYFGRRKRWKARVAGYAPLLRAHRDRSSTSSIDARSRAQTRKSLVGAKGRVVGQRRPRAEMLGRLQGEDR